MNDEERAAYIQEAAEKSDEMSFKINQVNVQEGRTVSQEAVRELHDDMARFTLARIMAEWQRRQEPPTQVVVTVKVEAR